MAVGGAVVRRGAEFWVGNQGVEGVDGDDGARVACGFELGLCGRDGGDYGRGGGCAGVDLLVADGDGGDVGPVACDGGDQGRGFGRGLGDVEDAREDLEVVHFGGGQDGRDLVAVGAVNADRAVGG